MENEVASPIPLGSAVASMPMPSDAAGIDAEIKSLSSASADTAMSSKARLDRLEALWQAKSAGADAAPAAPPQGPAEGFEPPISGRAYAFEQNTPPGLEVQNPEAMGSLKQSLANAGVPPAIANGAFGSIAELQSTGVYETDESYLGAVQGAKLSLHKALGADAAKAMIADALAWVAQATKADPSLNTAAEYALASPQAIKACAEMYRHGKR